MADEQGGGRSGSRDLARAGITASILIVGAAAFGLTSFDSGETKANVPDTPNTITQTITVSDTPQMSGTTSQPEITEVQASETAGVDETNTSGETAIAAPENAYPPEIVDDPPVYDTMTPAPTTVAQATTVSPVPQTAGTTSQQALSSLPSDDHGFINSTARCEGAQPAMAIGRTEKSVLVVCAMGNGTFEYRGIRLSDGAVLTAPAEMLSDGSFAAGADDGRVKYLVFPKELVITAGGTVYRREPMVEFRQPYSLSAGSVPSTPAPPTTQPPGPETPPPPG